MWVKNTCVTSQFLKITVKFNLNWYDDIQIPTIKNQRHAFILQRVLLLSIQYFNIVLFGIVWNLINSPRIVTYFYTSTNYLSLMCKIFHLHMKFRYLYNQRGNWTAIYIWKAVNIPTKCHVSQSLIYQTCTTI